MEDEGCGFDVGGLKGVDAAHFSNRMRQYLPLLQILERDVPSTQQGKTSAVVYDVPVNLLLDRDMKLASETALSEAYPAGKLLRGEEAAMNSLTSDHVNCVPTKQVGNVRETNMNGTLSRTSPFMGIDGIKGSVCGRKVFIHDVCICAVGGTPTVCRLLELFWDVESRQVVATVRMFRSAAEVRHVGETETRGGLLRTWEDCTVGGELLLEVDDVLGLAEIYTVDEMDADKHDGEWDQGAR
ncbi:expressed unknown protein [Ectocarpus siliculosus]|uniref:Uncharacterized protein n=1 Tax=Ectocarpus siliculosus TaxID=2880 RepID=D7FUZ8_ECTSI|nr:expressed unknown protein [Ectocarpus siliculosus]|eukprot:CBJ31804.1 expressed unknown protein [Ectocarpus siliculosus]